MEIVLLGEHPKRLPYLLGEFPSADHPITKLRSVEAAISSRADSRFNTSSPTSLSSVEPLEEDAPYAERQPQEMVGRSRCPGLLGCV